MSNKKKKAYFAMVLLFVGVLFCFEFCYIKNDYSIKRENVESVINVKSEELFISSNILTKFTAFIVSSKEIIISQIRTVIFFFSIF